MPISQDLGAQTDPHQDESLHDGLGSLVLGDLLQETFPSFPTQETI